MREERPPQEGDTPTRYDTQPLNPPTGATGRANTQPPQNPTPMRDNAQEHGTAPIRVPPPVASPPPSRTNSPRQPMPPPPGARVQRQTADDRGKRGGRAKSQRPPKVQMPRESNGLYLPAWSVLLMLGTVFVVAFAIVGGVILLGGTPAAENSPRIVIITAEPSLIPQGEVIPPTSALLPNTSGVQGAVPNFPLEGPTLPPVILTPTPQQIAIGNNIAVNSPDPVNVRSGAGTDQEFLFFANDGEAFTVVGGPTQATGYTWWQVEDPLDPSRGGWIAASFIELGQP